MSKTTKLPRLGNSPLRALDGTGKRIDTHGRKISPYIKLVETRLLKSNPINAKLFPALTIEEMANLIEDIRANNIHDPLIAKPDYTLISGHNRLEAAKELDLQHVPVRFLEDEITEEEEKRFIVADNLLRRHLGQSEKIELYRLLYPQFDQRIALRKNTTTILTPTENNQDNVQNQDLEPLTAVQIAEDTGQNVETVRKQLSRESAKNRASQTEAALASAERTPAQVVARRNEFQKIMREYGREIGERVKIYADALDDKARKRIAGDLRRLANQIEKGEND